MKKFTPSMAALMVVALAGSLPAADFYVDASNAGTEDGTQANPFNTIQEAIDAAADGDTINVAAGTYEETVDVTKDLTLLGPNAGISPNAGSRGAEAIVLATAHTPTDSTWDFNAYLVYLAGGANSEVTVDGFLFEGFNPALGGTGFFAPGGAEVGSTAGVVIEALDVEFRNNVTQHIAQFTHYAYGVDSNVTFEDNLVQSCGIEGITGFGNAFVGSTNVYGTFRNNTIINTRNGFQFQGHNAATAHPAIIDGNTIGPVESSGIFLNVMSGSAKNFSITNNSITGQGALTGTSAIQLISQSDGATARRHVITGNNAQDIASGFYFANNSTLSQRISGGELTNVGYAAVFANRLGYRGYIDYSGDLVGRDGTGGPAKFDSAVATAALDAGLTANIKVPDGGDSVDGSVAFTTDFTGTIALLADGADPGVAAQNAADAGAVAVIIARDSSTKTPLTLNSDTVTSVDIPTTSIDAGDGAAIRTALGSGSVSATLNSRLFFTNGFGVNAPAVIGGTTQGTLSNVKVNSAALAGFGVFDIPNDIGPGSTPGSVIGRVSGGSTLKNAPSGAVVLGENASLEVTSARFEDNAIGVEVIEGNLTAFASTFADNTEAGISLSGATATASIDSSNFFGAAQTVDISVSANPTGVVVSNSNFTADDTAIENNDAGSGDVLAQGNFWGDASGPNDDAGIINGSGARISLGVDAGGAVNEQSAPDTADSLTADSDGNNIPDFMEILLGADINNAAEPVVVDPTDSNANGIPDEVETALGLSLTDRDQDGDKIRDDYELFRGTDPQNGLDFPPFGDSNASGGTADNVDAVAMIEAFLGINDFTAINQFESDINLDGNIDNVDAIILFNLVVDNIPYIPFP